MLAVLKAGGAFVPLDPSHPVERLRGLCDSLDARLILCSGHLHQLVSGVVDTVLPVNDSSIKVESEPTPISLPTASSTNTAYVIFTSGSTGKPKVSLTRKIDVSSPLAEPNANSLRAL